MSRGVFFLSALFASLVVLAGGSALAGSDSGAFSTVIQPNGKIIAAGWGERGSQTVFGLARYEKGGSLDTGFGSRGKVTSPAGAAHALLLQPDGKIVAAGYTASGLYNTSWNFALARYTSKGALDASFGAGGKVKTAFGSRASYANAVAIQPGGKIVAAGTLLDKVNGKEAGFALARYNNDGELDSTFGSGGRVTTQIGSGSAATAMVIQPDGKIVAAGSSSGKFALARYNADGSLDSSFGTGGKVTTSIGSGSTGANAVALQPDGKIVAVGSVTEGSPIRHYGFGLARYNSDGSPDLVSMTIFIDFECDLCSASANAVVIQPNGKIVLGGQETSSARGAFALARYNGDGTLDTGFGIGGMVTTSFGFPEPANGTSGDVANSLALQPDGKILAAGYSQFGPHTEQYQVALARYGTSGALDTSFGKDGKVNTSVAACLVPKVKGKKLDWYSRHTITNAHCAVGKITRVYSRTVKNRYIISQSPKAGALRTEETKVSLTVSKGKRP